MTSSHPSALPQDRQVSVGGLRIRYWTEGEQGTPLVLLHGIGCSVLEWRHNVAALARSHRVFVPDLPGFGLSDVPAGGGMGLQALTRFVLDFADALGLASMHLAGNSLGGRLALQCALDAPARVRSLVLADPAGMARRGTLLEFRLATLPGLGELLTLPHAAGLRMLWRKAFARPDDFVTPELVQTKVALARRPRAHAAFLQTLRDFVDVQGFVPGPVAALQAGLPSVQAPTLVVWGAQDRFVPAAHAEVLRAGLPRADVQVWDDCGHVPQIEQADRFNTAVLSHLARAEQQEVV